MNRLSAVILLVTFLLYHTGYYVFYLFSSYAIEASWGNKIGADDFHENQLRETFLPISIPYLPDQENFVKKTGKFELDGRFFRVLKQRYAKDTIHIIYVQDVESQHLATSFRQWIASLNPEGAAERGSEKVLFTFVKNYLRPHFTIAFSLPTQLEVLKFS